MKFISLILLLFYFLPAVFAVADRIGCRDEDGNLVDWFYLYKLPNTVDVTVDNNVEKKRETGLNYLFVTSSSSKWIFSDKLINDSSSMPGLTLAELYRKDKNNRIKLLYNDEPPNDKSDEIRGHTKGVLVANDISGFWMIHSVPKFPPPIEDELYDYPESGKIYGQSFLCISMTGDQIGKVGIQLQFNEPHFYSSFVPKSLIW